MKLLSVNDFETCDEMKYSCFVYMILRHYIMMKW
jgi:hypothetical protein